MKKYLVISAVMLLACVSAFAAKIDLSVSPSGVVVSPGQPTPSSAITIQVTVLNEGIKASKASALKLKITKGGSKVYAFKNSLPAIQAGGSYDCVFSVPAQAEGSYNLMIKADPANSIPEISESNNTVNVSMTVTGGASGGVGQAAGAVFAGTQHAFDSMFGVFSAMGDAMPGQASESGDALRNIAGRTGGRPEETVSCTKSGTMTVEYFLDGLFRPSKFEVSYNNCQKWIDSGQGTYWWSNGPLSMDLTFQSDNPLDPAFYQISQMVMKAGDGDPASDTLPDYSADMYSASGKLEGSTADFTMTIGVFGYDDQGWPTQMGIYANGAQSFTDNEAGTTTSTTMDDLHIDVTMSGTEQDMTTTGVMAGTIDYHTTLPSDCAQSYTVTYNNLNFTDHTTTVQSEDTVNGQVVYSSAGLSGTFSITTLEPVITPAGSDCPVSGRLSIASALGNALIIYNADGTVSIDEGANGSIDVTVQNCAETVDNGDPC